MFMNE
ncbi:putative accessory gland protein, partial [Danaus plexippus plexippus]|jgi:hypothetical protein